MNRFKTATLTRTSAEDVLARFVTRLRVATINPVPLTPACLRMLNYYSLERKAEDAGLGNIYVELSLKGEDRGICTLILRCEWSMDEGDGFYDVGPEISWSSCGSQSPAFAEGFLTLMQTATELAREFTAAVAAEKDRTDARAELDKLYTDEANHFGRCACGGKLVRGEDGEVRCGSCDEAVTCICGGSYDIGSGGDVYCIACGRDGVDPELDAPVNG